MSKRSSLKMVPDEDVKPPYRLEAQVIRRTRPRGKHIRLDGIGIGEIKSIKRRRNGWYAIRAVFMVLNVQLFVARLDHRCISLGIH